VDKIEAGYPEALFATIPEIDKLTSGFAEAELVVLAARPGHGKTMVALQMVDLASQDGFAGLIVSEEMSIASLAKRTIPRIASIDKSQWKQGIHQVRYEMRQHFENSAPLVVREFCVTIDRVERAIASAVSRYGIRFCVVDYAQLIKADGRSKYEQTSEVSVRMKRAANRHGITIFLLAQLGRSIDTRDGFVPIMSDLKDTGQLEQDADVILAGIWPKKFDDSYADPHEYRIYQLKNRNRGVFQHVVRMHVDPIRQRLREEFEVHFDRF
jgi:replicative DNA helicase